jgi:hypothetical protein
MLLEIIPSTISAKTPAKCEAHISAFGKLKPIVLAKTVARPTQKADGAPNF